MCISPATADSLARLMHEAVRCKQKNKYLEKTIMISSNRAAFVNWNRNKIVETALDFIVDKLTNSIENALIGEVFDTGISRLTAKGSRKIKKTDWLFDWKKALRDATKEVYKLTTVNNPTIKGLLSVEDKQDHIFMHLIESSKLPTDVRRNAFPWT